MTLKYFQWNIFPISPGSWMTKKMKTTKQDKFLFNHQWLVIYFYGISVCIISVAHRIVKYLAMLALQFPFNPLCLLVSFLNEVFFVCKVLLKAFTASRQFMI